MLLRGAISQEALRAAFASCFFRDSDKPFQSFSMFDTEVDCALSTDLELRVCSSHPSSGGGPRSVCRTCGNAVIKSIILLQNFRQKQDQAFRGFISLRQSLTERQVGAGIKFSPNHHYIQGHSPKPSNRRLAPDCAPNRGEKAQRYPNIMNLPILL